jgi:hypothetical protein
MRTLSQYSMGVGDRFGHQGVAQLRALVQAQAAGTLVAPVWNKSNREHAIIGTQPPAVRMEADDAVRALGWNEPYFVDADHISLKNVDGFIASSDFFTLDVADFTGTRAPEADIRAFVERHRGMVGALRVPGLAAPIQVTPALIERAAAKFLLAVQEAGKLYRHIVAQRGGENFATEVSMDETDEAQGPVDMLFILAAVAEQGIPAQTIAPKFTGRFNKGVDYVGDLGVFAREFQQDLAVIRFAVQAFDLPPGLKLSVHSGSDKFSLYPIIRKAIRAAGAGLHLKTAGTTWLEEIAGLAAAGGEGLAIARAVYHGALGRYDELCGPYATVIDIDRRRLPDPADVDRWSGPDLAAALTHNPADTRYNPHFRQLLHVAYKVAAEMGPRYPEALRANADSVGARVTHNLYERHIRPLFLDA